MNRAEFVETRFLPLSRHELRFQIGSTHPRVATKEHQEGGRDPDCTGDSFLQALASGHTKDRDPNLMRKHDRRDGNGEGQHNHDQPKGPDPRGISRGELGDGGMRPEGRGMIIR